MTADTIKAISEAVTPLVNKLAQLGVAGFELATRQVYAEAIQSVAIAATFLAIFGVCIYWFKRGFTMRYGEGCGWRSGEVTGEGSAIVIASGLIGGLSAVISGVQLFAAIPMFINPQWYALQKLAELVK